MKLPKIKTLESRVWTLCKLIIRAKYPPVCVSCGKEVSGKGQHTGHLFRKKFLPLQMKYSLDLLQVQCAYCNLRLHGNLEWYFIYLLKNGYTPEFLIDISNKIKYYKTIELSVPEQREFLLSLEKEYAILLKSLPEDA